jgi:hypothetical protein
VSLQIEQRTLLQQREQELLRQLRDLRAQLVQVQTQAQQELQRPAQQAALSAAQSAAPAQPTLTPDQQRQQRELASASEAVRTQALAILRDHQSDLERNIAALDVQLVQVRTALGQLPPAEDPISALQQQTSQRQAESQRAFLTQREQGLARDIQSTQSQLLQLQAQHQQEVLRQLEDRRQSVLAISAAAGGGNDASQAAFAAAQQQARQLAGASSGVRSQWLQVLSEQQREVESNIAAVTGRLTAVRQALVDHPSEGDPAVAAAFTRAYGEQLQALTQEFARLQMNSQAAMAPLVRFGAATDALPAVRAKRTLVMGTGAGLAVGVGVAYALEAWRRRRAARVLVGTRPAVARAWQAGAESLMVGSAGTWQNGTRRAQAQKVRIGSAADETPRDESPRMGAVPPEPA